MGDEEILAGRVRGGHRRRHAGQRGMRPGASRHRSVRPVIVPLRSNGEGEVSRIDPALG